MPRNLFSWFIVFVLSAISGKAIATSENLGDEKIQIRNIRFKGNEITRPHIILREMSLAAGDSILSSELEDVLIFNRKRILNLQLFSVVNYHVLRIDDKSIDIEFELIEIFFWIPKPVFSLADRNFNVWWKLQNRELDRTNIGIQLTRMNFRGLTERIGGTVQVGYNKYFDLFYKIPFIDKQLKRGLGISATYSTGREINHLTDSNRQIFFHNDQYPFRYFQTELTYTYRPAYAIIHELNLSYNHFGISHALFERNPDFLNGKHKINYLELKFNFIFNNTDFRIYPLSGIDAKAVVSKKGLLIDKDVNQFSVRTEFSYYKRLTRRWSTSLVFRGRFSFPQQQPYLLNRALGFKNEYVRGYEYFVIDGSHYAITRLNLRYRLIDRVVQMKRIKIMPQIPLRIYAKAFDDLGFVYAKYPGDSRLNNRMLHGYGVGLDLILSYYLRFRFEYTFNHLNQNGLFLHTTKE